MSQVHHGMFHAITALLAISAVASAAGVGSLTTAPEAEVLINNRRVIRVMGDSITSGVHVGDSDYWVAYDVRSGTIDGARAEFELPFGIDEFEADLPVWGRWDPTELTWTAWHVEPLAGMQVYEFESFPTRVQIDLPYSATRTISNPIMTADTVVQTVSLDLTFDPTFSGYDHGAINLVAPWEAPDDFTYSILSVVAPEDWVEGASGPAAQQIFCVVDSDQLAGKSYHFEAVVEVTKSGPWAGVDVYHKPLTFMGFNTDTCATQTATSVTMNVGAVAATFSADEPVDFQTHAGVSYDLDFQEAIAPVGSASIEEIEVVFADRRLISGDLRHVFNIDILGESIVAAAFTTPGGQTYTMEPDDIGQWDWDIQTVDPADLAPFGPGVYTVTVIGSDDAPAHYDVTVGVGAPPTDAPVLDQAGDVTADPRPELTWAAPIDPEVNSQFFGLIAMDDQFEVEFFDDSNLQAYTPTADLAPGAYVVDHYFITAVSQTAGDATCAILYASGAQSYFNISKFLGGDADGDGDVDLGDFVILKNNFGSDDAAWADGDFDFDGDVDLGDFVILKNNFGS